MSLADAYGERDEGLARVSGERSSPAMKKKRKGWIVYGAEWMREYCRENRLMFADDLWELGLDDWDLDRRIAGAATAKLSREGTIKESGIFRPRVQGHAAKGPVWESLIYEGRRDA